MCFTILPIVGIKEEKENASLFHLVVLHVSKQEYMTAFWQHLKRAARTATGTAASDAGHRGCKWDSTLALLQICLQ